MIFHSRICSRKYSDFLVQHLPQFTRLINDSPAGQDYVPAAEASYLCVCLTPQAVDAVGEILLSLSYLPTAERLTVVVAKCKNLIWTSEKNTAGEERLHVMLFFCLWVYLSCKGIPSTWDASPLQNKSHQNSECSFKKIICLNNVRHMGYLPTHLYIYSLHLCTYSTHNQSLK